MATMHDTLSRIIAAVSVATITPRRAQAVHQVLLS